MCARVPHAWYVGDRCECVVATRQHIIYLIHCDIGDSPHCSLILSAPRIASNHHRLVLLLFSSSSFVTLSSSSSSLYHNPKLNKQYTEKKRDHSFFSLSIIFFSPHFADRPSLKLLTHSFTITPLFPSLLHSHYLTFKKKRSPHQLPHSHLSYSLTHSH